MRKWFVGWLGFVLSLFFLQRILNITQLHLEASGASWLIVNRLHKDTQGINPQVTSSPFCKSQKTLQKSSATPTISNSKCCHFRVRFGKKIKYWKALHTFEISSLLRNRIDIGKEVQKLVGATDRKTDSAIASFP